MSNDLPRCEALTGPGHPCWWGPANECRGLALCDAHWRVLLSGKALRIGNGRQARIAKNMNGRDPKLRIAQLGFDDNETRQETAA